MLDRGSLKKVCLIGLVMNLFQFVACNSSEPKIARIKKVDTNPTATKETGEQVTKPDLAKGKFFADIDIYRMQGVDEVDDKTFPSIYIEKTGPGTRKVVFRNSREYSRVVPYEYEDGFWVGTWEERADTGFARFYQFSQPEKVIELTFFGTWDKENFRLRDASIFENNKHILYAWNGQPGFDVKAEVASFDIVRKKHDTVIEEVYVRSGGKLFVKQKNTDQYVSVPNYESERCYEIGNHSLIWFYHFGYDLPCRN